MNEKEKLNELMGSIQKKQNAHTLALIVLGKILDDYREVEDLAGMLFALRDLLNQLLRDMPIEE